jgi:hypothetical protein
LLKVCRPGVTYVTDIRHSRTGLSIGRRENDEKFPASRAAEAFRRQAVKYIALGGADYSQHKVLNMVTLGGISDPMAITDGRTTLAQYSNMNNKLGNSVVVLG